MSDLPITDPSLEKNSSPLDDSQNGHDGGTIVDKEAVVEPAPSPRQVIASDFANTDKLAWLSVGYHFSNRSSSATSTGLTEVSSFMIGGVAAVLPFGKLYGLFNAKTLYIGSVTLFMVGSAICGAAPNIDSFIVGRVIAGAGGNGIEAGVPVVGVRFPLKPLSLLHGALRQANRGLVFGIGTVIGPVIGGGFAESAATWRWGFYINLCVGGLFAPVFIFLLPGFDPRGFDPKGPQKLASRFKEFDYIGAVLSVATLVCIIMATNFGGTLYPWYSGHIITLFVLAGVFVVAFAVQQTLTLFTTESDRMFPVQFLKMKEPVLLFIAMAAANAGGFIAIYYIPAYFAFVRGDAPVESAVRLLPLIVFISTLVLVNGALIAKLGFYQPWYLAGGALALIGGVLMYRVDINTSTANIYGYEVLLGIGTGAYIQAGYGVIQAIIEPAKMAYAISFIMLAQLLGIALGLSISGAVFLNKAISGLSVVLPDVSRDEIQNAVLGVSGDLFGTLPADVRRNATNAIVNAIDKTCVLHTALLNPFLSTFGSFTRDECMG
ncbi:MAG: hypothetical protein Q9192_007272 [Flavoplaca navasiana]